MILLHFLRFLKSASHPFTLTGLVLSVLLLAACESTDGNNNSQASTESEFTLPDSTSLPTTFIEALERPSPWVDSVMKTLTLDQRIAQLIIIEAFSDKGPKYEADVMRLIEDYHVGGIIFFQGGPVRQAKLTNMYQAAAKVPLMITMDAEAGIGMRLDSTVQYPFQMMLGAIEDNGLIYRMGAEVAREFKRLGMHVNFAPVADINNNPNNPIISYRAFGENRDEVTAKSVAYMRGMQDNGIVATAKHFPGHGDTDIDSHHDLPIIPFRRDRLDSLELHPFRELIAHGVGGIMVAHMHMPLLDSTTNLPSTLSRPIVTGLLKEELQFNGLVFTDAMVMKGVTNYFSPGEAEARALIAGNDVLERLTSVPKAINAIKAAIRRGDLKVADINSRCRKMLAAKQWLGLDKYKPIELNNLYQDLNPPEADSTNTAIAEAALTLLLNKNDKLPLKQRRRQSVATVSLGAVRPTVFQRHVKKYATTTDFVISRKAKPKEIKALQKKLKKFDLVLVALYGPSIRPSNNLGYSDAAKGLVRDLARSGKAVVTLFDNAYTLNQFPGVQQSNVLLVAYQPHAHAQIAAAKLLYGHIPAQGKLPVTVNKLFSYGDGIKQDAQ